MDSKKRLELIELLHVAGVINDEARKSVSEGQRFAGTRLQVGQLLVLQNFLTAEELNFALETIESIRASRLTQEEAIIAVRKKLNKT